MKPGSSGKTVSARIGEVAESFASSRGHLPGRWRQRDQARQRAARATIWRNRMVCAAIWALFASILALDFITSRENVSVCFAYVIPIFVSLFEARPRPVFYAAVASVLPLAEPLLQPPPDDLSIVEEIGHRLVTVLTQWLAAMLVRLQLRLLADAQDKAEFQQRFVDILSHEIGTALTAVTGQAYRLTKLSERLAPTDVVVRAEKIRKAADGIQAIISRIQFASSLGDGSFPAGQNSINLHAVIREVVEQLKEEQRGRCIDLDVCPKPLLVQGDEMLLRHVFENVIANGIKYSPPDAPISISIREHGSAVRVAIADRGRGIPQDDLPRVCTPYYRGENSRGIRGTGLGLYVVERIVDAHRGRLLIESAVDQGTRVTIELPQTSALVVA